MKRGSITVGILMLIFPLLGIAQEKGIQFQQLNWREVLKKAKAEKKYIFVDCYASWCGPCKHMDNEVYNQDTIGAFYNDHFISIKLQLDTSKNDSKEVEERYGDASYLSHRYSITTFPSFLFFSPEGKLVHRSLGFTPLDDFLQLGKNALNPQRQYYTLLERYEKNKVDSSCMYLSMIAELLGDTTISRRIGRSYVSVLLTTGNDKQFQPSTIEFIMAFTMNSNDPGFPFLYRNINEIDHIMKDSNYVERYIDYIIAKEDIDPVMGAAVKSDLDSPNWESMALGISEKYTSTFSDRTIANAKARWYQWKQNWPELTRNIVALVNNYGSTIQDFDKAKYAWTIFQHSDNKEELEAALLWTQTILVNNPNWPQVLDTYANILYKLGDAKKGIAVEEKAAKLGILDKEIQENFEKMKRGKPTW